MTTTAADLTLKRRPPDWHIYRSGQLVAVLTHPAPRRWFLHYAHTHERDAPARLADALDTVARRLTYKEQYANAR